VYCELEEMVEWSVRDLPQNIILAFMGKKFWKIW
jgi:hypothetical protein